MNGYVYRFLDKYENIIYVGSCGSIDNRMKQHFTKGHLPQECYDMVEYIDYAETQSRTEAYMFESYEISTIRPRYNSVGKIFNNSNRSDMSDANKEDVQLGIFQIVNLPDWNRVNASRYKNNFTRIESSRN